MIVVRCGKCGHKIKVINTGTWHGDVLRERRCVKCGERYFTREVIDSSAKNSLKKARNKIARGMENELHS